MLQTLGNGTFGRVRLVKLFSEKDSFYALKAMKKMEIMRQKQFKHVVSEINIMSIIHHNFIVDMIGHFQDEGRVYIGERVGGVRDGYRCGSPVNASSPLLTIHMCSVL